MSSTLRWQPTDPQVAEVLSSELKFAMRQKYGDPIFTILTAHSIPYLRSLYISGIADAMVLIKALEEHGSVTIREQWN